MVHVGIVVHPSKSADIVVKAIHEHLTLIHGSPRIIITDNGTEFANNINDAINCMLDIRQKTTTAYHPQANAVVENQNRTLKDMIAVLVDKDQSNWDDFLAVVTHAYRTTINAATGFTPFFAVFGREARQPSEDWIEDFVSRRDIKLNEYVSDLARALLDTWTMIDKKIKSNQEKANIRQNNDFNLKYNITEYISGVKPSVPRIFRPFQKGDFFFMKAVPRRYTLGERENSAKRKRKKIAIAAKLQFRYTGPHVVVEVLSPILYLCEVNGKRQRVHASKMKRDNSIRSSRAIDDEYINEDEEDNDSENKQDLNPNLSDSDSDSPSNDVSNDSSHHVSSDDSSHSDSNADNETHDSAAQPKTYARLTDEFESNSDSDSHNDDISDIPSDDDSNTTDDD